MDSFLLSFLIKKNRMTQVMGYIRNHKFIFVSSILIMKVTFKVAAKVSDTIFHEVRLAT